MEHCQIELGQICYAVLSSCSLLNMQSSNYASSIEACPNILHMKDIKMTTLNCNIYWLGLLYQY